MRLRLAGLPTLRVFATSAAAAILLAAACGSDPPLAQEEPAPPAQGPGIGRGLLAGIDTSLRSVDLGDIHFDLFNGSSISLAEADEATIVRLVDAIIPLDAAPELLSREERPRIGAVRYDAPDAIDFIAPDDLMLGYVADDGRPYAFPIGILNFHEIVNDTLAGRAIVMTYCPLCRSGVVYDRVLDGRLLTFGNTSALYQNDLVMFDRQTNSYWPQTGGKAVVGVLTGARLAVLPSSMTTYDAWLRVHPDTLVLSSATGLDRSYASDPFRNYATSVNAGRVPFPVSSEFLNDNRLPSGDLVLVVDDGERARAYPLNQLGDAALHDTWLGEALVVFATSAGPAGNVFRARLDGQTLRFEFDTASRLYVDTATRSSWDLAGRAVDGELAGAQLEQVPSRTAFWFSILASFSEVELIGAS